MFPIDPARYALFCGVTALFSLFPGPANLFMVATGAQSGWRGLAAANAGLNAGSLVWIAAAAFGLSALATAYPTAFHLLSIAGALYVGWLGGKTLWSAFARSEASPAHSPTRIAGRSAFGGGVAVQISNPKALLYFGAVLPPFVDPARPAAMQFAILCVTMVFADVLVFTGYGLAGGAFAGMLQRRGSRRVFSGCTGALLVGVAVFILLRH